MHQVTRINIEEGKDISVSLMAELSAFAEDIVPGWIPTG